MNIGKAIYGILSGTTAVTDIVGTKIFPEIAEQETAVPFVVYQVQSVQPEDTHDGPSKLDEVRVEVLCYDDAYNGAADLASAVRGALDRVRGTYNGVNVESVQFNDVDFEIEYDPRRYSQVLTFTFRIKRDDIEIALGTPITGAQLGDLSDVNVTGVTDNQILSYDAASDTWVPAADAGGAEVLNDLTDVDASQPADNQMLAYQQGEWTTINQDEIVLPIASVTGLQAELNTIPDGLDDLDDVKIIGTPAEGEALVYQSGFWSRGTAGASTLGDLDDVNTTGAGFGSTIVYNGSTWEISGSALPSDDIYYHNRYLTEAAALRSGATETVELYYTAQADGDGLSESASSDTPTSGYDIRRKLYYAEKAQADPDTSADWTQFTAIADNTTFNNAKAALLAYLKERTGGTVPISLKMTWEEVAQAPSFTGLLNESYGSGAEAAYSTRRLNGNVTECMVIRRASDSTTTTIGFDGSGNIDESAIETFCTGTTCTVVTWKDQSGNNRDVTQTTPSRQPKIYDAGIVLKEGKATLDFTGTRYMVASTASDWNFLHDGTESTFASVVQFGANSADTAIHPLFGTTTTASGSPGFTVFSSNGAYRAQVRTDTGNVPLSLNAAGQVTEGTQALYFHYNDLTNATAADRAFAYKDGGANFANNTSTDGLYTGDADSPLYVGSLGSAQGSLILNGGLQELIFWASNKTGGRTSIEENIADYFTQNTPLLDTYSGAAAAYSLRLLDSTYTGSAVEVYNGSSYADIGFNVFGELDTVALAAHCGSNDGFVSKWYDQSGNSNDATQATTANMPKIYDGSTGVVTENGKPAVEFDGTDDNLDATSSVSTTVFTLFTVVDNGGISGVPTTPNYNNDSFCFDFSTRVGTRTEGVGFNTATTASREFKSIYWLADSANSEAAVMNDTATTGTNGAFTAIHPRLGSRNAFNNKFTGHIYEVIYYPSDQSANRTNIEDNINTFYNIY